MNAENELDCLRRAIRRDRQFSNDLRLSKGEAKMLALLYKRERVRAEALAAVFCNGGLFNADSLKVGLSRLRQKLPAGCVISKEMRSYRLHGREQVKQYIERV